MEKSSTVLKHQVNVENLKIKKTAPPSAMMVVRSRVN